MFFLLYLRKHPRQNKDGVRTMAYDAIISGPGVVYVQYPPALTSTTLATLITNFQKKPRPGTFPSGFSKMGSGNWDDGGITLSGELDITRERVDGELYPVAAFFNSASLMLSGALKDFSPETLAYQHNKGGDAFTSSAATATAAGITTLDVGISPGSPREYGLLVLFHTPYGGYTADSPPADTGAMLVIPRAVPTAAMNSALARGQAATVPIEFEALKPTASGLQVAKMAFLATNPT